MKRTLCPPNDEESDCQAVAIHVRAAFDTNYWIKEKFKYYTVIDRNEKYLKRAMDYMKKRFSIFYSRSSSRVGTTRHNGFQRPLWGLRHGRRHQKREKILPYCHYQIMPLYRWEHLDSWAPHLPHQDQRTLAEWCCVQKGLEDTTISNTFLVIAKKLY